MFNSRKEFSVTEITVIPRFQGNVDKIKISVA